MLGKDAAGEALSARDALIRMCKSQDRDMHDLAGAFIAALAAAPKRTNGAKVAPDYMASFCLNENERLPGLLSPKELEFVHDMLSWKRPTEKQLAWLEKIYQRAVRRHG